MQSIPIIVSRFNEQGVKEYHTIEQSTTQIINGQTLNCDESRGDKLEFNTIDQCENKNKRVRVKRIQSSGGRRRLPKDFFSRESQRSSQKPIDSNRQTKTVERSEEDQRKCTDEGLTTSTIQNNQYNVETPKFKQKYLETTPIHKEKNIDPIPNSNCGRKNHHSSNKIKIRSTTKKSVLSNSNQKQASSQPNSLRSTKGNQDRPNLNQINNFPPQQIYFQNTFSANQFSQIPKWTCKPFEINMLKNKNGSGKVIPFEKENLPMRKKSKVNEYKQNQLKKFSLIKEKTGYFNMRNLAKFQ